MIQALLTAIPIILAAWWLAIGLGALWRRTVWHAVGDELARSSGDLRPVWGGYRLIRPGVRVTWRGGIRGRSTVVRSADGKRRFEDWVSPSDSAVLGDGPPIDEE